jgi:hypothetical protein
MRNTSRLDRTQARAILITAVALGSSQFEAWCDDQLIVACTREPFLNGARALLAAGYHPDTIVTMRHAGSDVDALTARIGTAARFHVEESGHGPILRSVRKAPPSAVDQPPIAQIRRACSKHHHRGEGARPDGLFDERQRPRRQDCVTSSSSAAEPMPVPDAGY